MKTMLLTLFTITAFVITGCTSCKKSADNNGLPPATQTGANTFGALVNGQVWTPNGYSGTANLTISYDLGYAYGTLNVSAYRIIDSANLTGMGVSVDSLNNYVIPHTFILKPNSNTNMVYNNQCWYESSKPSTYSNGFITISKLDKQQGIISGTFAAQLYKPGCDTVNITEGRFDMKLH